MTASALTAHLNWTPVLREAYGRAWRSRGIRVFVDFAWENLVGHAQITFTNYMSLAAYVQRQLPAGKQRVLILTNQDSRPEGRQQDSSDFEILVVNIQRYREVAKNDAAGAYFAGLQGVPVIRAQDLSARRFTRDEAAALLDVLGSAESVAGWISRHPEEMASLGRLLDQQLAANATTQELVELLGERIRNTPEQVLPKLASLIGAIDFPSNILHAASLARRKEATEVFRRHFDQRDWLETQWQEFFQQEDWIFGHGLLYQFTHLVQRETYVGRKNMSNRGGQFADFSVRTVGVNMSFIALVDIKTPCAKLVSSQRCRNGAYAISAELAEAVAQVLANCDAWNREGSVVPDNVRRSAQEGWLTAQPRGILVVGASRSLGDDDARQSFELFRRHLHGVEILTFDELLMRAVALSTPTEALSPGAGGAE